MSLESFAFELVVLRFRPTSGYFISRGSASLLIDLRARGSPFSIELRVFRFRPRGSSLSASSSTWFLIN